jgi:hypothetical protein
MPCKCLGNFAIARAGRDQRLDNEIHGNGGVTRFDLRDAGLTRHYRSREFDL